MEIKTKFSIGDVVSYKNEDQFTGIELYKYPKFDTVVAIKIENKTIYYKFANSSTEEVRMQNGYSTKDKWVEENLLINKYNRSPEQGE